MVHWSYDRRKHLRYDFGKRDWEDESLIKTKGPWTGLSIEKRTETVGKRWY